MTQTLNKTEHNKKKTDDEVLFQCLTAISRVHLEFFSFLTTKKTTLDGFPGLFNHLYTGHQSSDAACASFAAGLFR